MTKTQSGNIIIHKEVWDKLKNDDYYQDLIEQLEDIEDHYEAKLEGEPKEFSEFIKEVKDN